MTDLSSKIDELERRFHIFEGEIHAYAPENGRFSRLRREARTLAETYPSPDSRPPLYGSLVGVKDIFHVDGFPTRAGSRLPPELLHGPQAESVRLLRHAGALIVGKTVTTEFAYFGPGPTRNPHNPGHTPGGSSSGSAAAAAAGLCDAALGTQTIGSINRPASFCGVFGFKPSRDRISTQGVIPLSVSLDHVGLLSADFETLSNLASILCRDWRPGEAKTGPVLGVPAGPYLLRADEEGQAQFEKDRPRLESAGFAIREVPMFADFDRVVSRHNLVVAAEAARTHREWFEQHHARYHPKTAELIETGSQISDEELSAARLEISQFRQDLVTVMESEGIDLWISPSAPGAAPLGLESTGNPVMNLPWTQAGLPTLTIPSGRNPAGLPLGLQLTGSWYRDEALLGWGARLAGLFDPVRLVER